ncbi:C2H2 finger domain-containing protein, partial [Colletotrichum limetticola]
MGLQKRRGLVWPRITRCGRCRKWHVRTAISEGRQAVSLFTYRFCAVIKRDVQQCYETISTRIVHTFFDWFLNQKVGKDGRKKRGIKKKSSLGTYWKVFRLVFERAVLRRLSKRHGLDDQRRANRCMVMEDLMQQNETTLSTTKKSFKLEEMRILAVLFLLLLTPAGPRPTATLNLRFKDIR